MPSAAGAEVMWCSKLCWETQRRQVHDSAHWEGLFELIKCGRSTAHEGKQSQEIPEAVQHALVV